MSDIVNARLKSTDEMVRYLALTTHTRKAVFRQFVKTVAVYSSITDDRFQVAVAHETAPFPHDWEISEGRMSFTVSTKADATISDVVKALGLIEANRLNELAETRAASRGDVPEITLLAANGRYQSVRVKCVKDYRSGGYGEQFKFEFSVVDDRAEYAKRFEGVLETAGYTIFDLVAD